MSTSQTLALYSNYALYSAMAVLVLSMLGFGGYLAGLIPARSERKEEQRARELVAAGGVELVDHDAAADELLDVPRSDAGRPLDDGVSLTARKFGGAAVSLAWLGAALLVLSVALRGLSVSRAPLGNMFEFSVVAATFAMLVFCAWSTRRDLRWLGLFVVTPTLLLLGVALRSWYTEAAELMPSLQSYWLVIHVTVAVLAMAVFFIGSVMGVLYLLKDRAERTGTASILDRFPSAKSLERFTYGLHVIGFPLWTFTLIAGAIWARQAWASYWNWDPKEVWTFVIWVVYAAYLHARVTSGWSKQRATYIAIAGFVCIILNYTVVNVFFVSQHSYSGL